jgi:hypothetical protein
MLICHGLMHYDQAKLQLGSQNAFNGEREVRVKGAVTTD